MDAEPYPRERMDALTLALANSQASYERCAKAASASPERLFASGPGGVSATPLSLTTALEQYSHNRGWVFACVAAISKRVAGQRICVAKPKRVRSRKSYYESIEPLDSHPILDLFADPNPLMTGWSIVYSMVSSMLLTGRAHVWMDDKALWYLPSHWCEPQDAMRGNWLIRPGGLSTNEVEIPGDDMIYVPLPNPEDPFGVLSPLQAQAPAVATDEALQMAQYRAFKNGIFPGLMIKLSENFGREDTPHPEVPILDATQRASLVDALKRMYGGAMRYGEPLIADGLIGGVERLTSTNQEMDFINSSEMIKQRICQSFGVNAIILGAAIDANRASATVAEQSFCTNVINPICTLISSALTAWLGSRYGVQVWIEPAVANDEELSIKKWESASRLGFVTCNEYRRSVLNLDDIAGGDERLLPGNMISESELTVVDDAESTSDV